MAQTGELGAQRSEGTAFTRRRLLLRDSLTFLSLTLVTVALFTITFLLFRSFATHRTELGRRWSDRGRASLEQGRPEDAIDSLRTALSYSPGERSYELLLAQALAEAHHTDEAYNYFTGLWDTQPGSGFINLQLARLAAEKNEPAQTVNFYRASIYGTWEGDGVARRRDVRLELARYLVAHHDLASARAELLVAEGNADNDPALSLKLGQLLQEVGDDRDAFDAYQKSAEGDPKNPVPLAAAGRLAFSMGEFTTAQHLLQQAVRAADLDGKRDTPEHAELSDLLHKTDRLLELAPDRKLPSPQRVARLLTFKTLARARLDSCLALPAGLAPQLQDLTQRWSATAKTATRAALLRDQSRQDELLQLIDDTENRTATLCGKPTGDDALILLLSHDPKAVDR